MRRRLAEAQDLIDRVRLLPSHVDVMLAAGAPAEAEAAAVELSRLASTYGTVALGARADFASAVVRLAGDDPEPALVELRRAVAAWRSLQSPYEEARTRVRIAEACRALGDEEAATLEEAAANESFGRLGAAMGSTKQEPSHPLSPRELEVLALVATGMTNQQIADELFLAVKTIERHVGNILMKLDVPSRTGATAYAYEHHLV
jgi:DNA-binding NarL/FixJ family response regulator